MARDDSNPAGTRQAGGAAPNRNRPNVEHTGSDRWLVTHETVVSELVPLPGSAAETGAGKAPGKSSRADRQQHKTSSRTRK